MIDVEVVTDWPIGDYHRHTWRAVSGDDRWRCDCTAEVRALTRADKTVIALPEAVTG